MAISERIGIALIPRRLFYGLRYGEIAGPGWMVIGSNGQVFGAGLSFLEAWKQRRVWLRALSPPETAREGKPRG
jgi:hypothetical protein